MEHCIISMEKLSNRHTSLENVSKGIIQEHGLFHGLDLHNMRNIDVSYADKDFSKYNEHLQWNDGISLPKEKTTSELLDLKISRLVKEKKKVDGTVKKIRNDAVRGVSFVLSASSEFFEEINNNKKISRYDENKEIQLNDWGSLVGYDINDRSKWNQTFLSWYEKQFEFIKEKYGYENITCSHLHLDEKTPHIHVVVLPQKNGALNFKKSIADKKQDLTKMLDDYSEKMKVFGLERGERKEGKINTTIQDYRNNSSTFRKQQENYEKEEIVLKNNMDELKSELRKIEEELKYKELIILRGNERIENIEKQTNEIEPKLRNAEKELSYKKQEYSQVEENLNKAEDLLNEKETRKIENAIYKFIKYELGIKSRKYNKEDFFHPTRTYTDHTPALWSHVYRTDMEDKNKELKNANEKIEKDKKIRKLLLSRITDYNLEYCKKNEDVSAPEKNNEQENFNFFSNVILLNLQKENERTEEEKKIKREIKKEQEKEQSQSKTKGLSL